MDLVAIGKISKPIGISGEAKILPLTDDLQRFSGLTSVFIGSDESTTKPYDLCSVRIVQSQVAVKLQGIETAQDVENIRNAYVFIPKKEVVALQDGRFFMDDVIGCEVVTDEETNVGKVIDLFSLPGNDVWIVRNGTKEIFIPAVKAIIRKVDVKKKCITIHAFEGLLD